MATTGSLLTYDFTPALATFDPYHQYSTSPLSGGMVNITVRVNISDPTQEHECPFEGAWSVVAKYAPAFVASVGESAPFSQYRQVIEARALALLSQPSVNAYIQSSCNVIFPELIHHDPAMNVLIMSDLGETDTLDKWLVSGPNLEVVVEVGRRFGEFLGRLGSFSDDVNQVNALPNLYELFDSPLTHEFNLDVTIAPIESYLLECGYNSTDAALVKKLCISMHERQQARLKRFQGGVFGIGDDWEFAGMVYPLIDLAQLCAHLYIICLVSSAEIKSKVKAYALAMIHAYHASTPEWHHRDEYRVDAWIHIGRVIISNIIEIDWWDGNDIKKQVELRVLGAHGAAFVKEAEQRGSKEGLLFEDIFNGL
ncbi:unnamed protein product [Rhizoctonia solani]|uniref:Aminoglycoside phosphotransferase domain-containing protein n=1 Tax=Rhizoctonia solani TaxID=456999 RepID=A0A8H3DV22_9AGAM|nr:unnamed protein product [Rhizoctonia solani]